MSSLHVRTFIAELARTLNAWVAPYCCAVCQNTLLDSESVLCVRCNPGTELLCATAHVPSCVSCGQPTAAGICPLCELSPLPTRYARSVWLYEAQVVALIKAYKYRGVCGLRTWFLTALLNAIDSFPSQNWDCIIPMPSSMSHIQDRGFDHVASLARALASQRRVDFLRQALTRRNEQPTQSSLKIEARFHNVSDGFFCKPRLVCDKNILLVDDVLTTGASVSEASRVLLHAGARNIDVLTIARSSKFCAHRVSARLRTYRPTVVASLSR